MTYEEYIKLIGTLGECLYRIPDDFYDLAAELGIVIFKPYMGDNAFILEGALEDMYEQPTTGCYQPQPEDFDGMNCVIKLDSVGFVHPEEAERYATAAVINLGSEFPMMSIPHALVRMRPNTYSRAWYVIFEKRNLPEAPEGAKRGCDLLE